MAISLSTAAARCALSTSSGAFRLNLAQYKFVWGCFKGTIPHFPPDGAVRYVKWTPFIRFICLIDASHSQHPNQACHQTICRRQGMTQMKSNKADDCAGRHDCPDTSHHGYTRDVLLGGAKAERSSTLSALPLQRKSLQSPENSLLFGQWDESKMLVPSKAEEVHRLTSRIGLIVSRYPSWYIHADSLATRVELHFWSASAVVDVIDQTLRVELRKHLDEICQR